MSSKRNVPNPTKFSSLIRIDKKTKEFLDSYIKDNKQFRSYAHALDFLLTGKFLSPRTIDLMKSFLEKKKRCTNFKSQLNLSKRRIDLVGGRIIKGKQAETEIGHLLETELHLIELKKNQDEELKGLGQMILYKHLIQKSNSWIDNLYLYVAIEDEISDVLKDTLEENGFGLLWIDRDNAKIREILEPKEQTRLMPKTIKKYSKMECENCFTDTQITQNACKRCNNILKFNFYQDKYKRTNVKLTNSAKKVIETDQILKQIFSK